MTLDDFYTKYNGQSVSFDGLEVNRGQCVQLVEFYVTEVLGLQPFWGNAVDWWNNYGGSLTVLDKIPYTNYTTDFPKRGDIVIWRGDLPNSGGYGHIDVCVSDGTATGFTGFDSNWGGKTAHLVQHDYSYVIGYLRRGTMPSLATEEDVKRLLLAYMTPDQITTEGGDSYVQGFVGTELSSLIQSFADSPQFLAKRQQEDAAPNQVAQIKAIVS